jgi:hypothetical protein
MGGWADWEIRRSRGSPLKLSRRVAGEPTVWIAQKIMHTASAKCRSEMIDRMQIHLQLRRTFASFLGARLRSSGVHA